MAACPAGDICALARLASAETGDTLSSPEDPRLVPPWDLPTPQLPVAVEAASRADEDRLATALARLVAEDPTVRLERRPDTGQLLLWCVGEAHAEVLLERLRTRHGVAVNTVPVRVPMVETLAGPARVTGRHVKQSGGHGQYAVVVVEAEPGPPGSGVVFEQRIVGGTVPSQFHGSVEKGVRTQAQRGISGDRPLVDVHLTLVDGKSHSVDSSDAAFQAAGALALRELAAAAGTRVLEPWCEVEVVVPGEYVGCGHERPLRTPGAGHRQRGRPGPRPDDGARGGARDRAAELSRASCARSPTAPAASPGVRSATSRLRPRSRCPPERLRPAPPEARREPASGEEAARVLRLASARCAGGLEEQ